MPFPKLSFEAKLIFILSILVAFGPMSIDMYLPAFAIMANEFHVDISLVQYTLASFNIGIALGQLAYGPLSDQFGRKNILLVGMVIYLIASVSCALATSIHSMILLRFLQAIGGCAGMVTARAVVRDRFNGNQAAKVFSTMMLIMGVAPIIAPTVGGLALVHFDWRAIFWLLSILSAAAILGIAIYLPETLPHEKRNPHAIRRSLKNYHTIFKDKIFLGYALSAGMLQAGMFAYITGSSFVFIKLYNFTEQQYGMLFGINAFGFIAASQLNHYLLKRMNFNQILQRAILFNFVAAICLLVFSTLGWFSLNGILLPLFLTLSSVGLILPNASAGALAHQTSHIGSASALLGTIMFTCGALAAFAVSAFAHISILPMTITMAISSLCGLLCFMWLKSNVPPNENKILED